MTEGSGLGMERTQGPAPCQTVMAGKGRRFKPRKWMCARESLRRKFEGGKGKSCHGALES